MQPLPPELDYCDLPDAIAPYHHPTTIEFVPLSEVISAIAPLPSSATPSLPDPTLDEVSAPATNDRAANDLPDAMLRWILSGVLKVGVIIASAMVLLGGILYLIRHGSELVDYRVFHGEPEFLRTPKGVMQGAIAGHRLAFIQLGVLVLMATPMLRVVVSCATFLWHRDRVYSLLTLLVLAGLVYSVSGIK